MKSMCTALALMCGTSAGSAIGAEYASPSARWLAAFSSSNVVKNVRPSLPIRLSRSTSATSPSRDAPSSTAQRWRNASAFVSASISTARPPSKRMRRPVTSEPETSSGFVAVTTPSVRPGSGVV